MLLRQLMHSQSAHFGKFKLNSVNLVPFLLLNPVDEVGWKRSELCPDELRVDRASLRGRGVAAAEERRGHLPVGDDAAVGDLAAVGHGHTAVLAMLLRQGRAGVREGRHIQAGQAQEGRRIGARTLLHTAVYRQLQVRLREMPGINYVRSKSNSPP